jgi:hypothetical protein
VYWTYERNEAINLVQVELHLDCRSFSIPASTKESFRNLTSINKSIRKQYCTNTTIIELHEEAWVDWSLEVFKCLRAKNLAVLLGPTE